MEVERASRDAAKATITKAQAELLSKQATFAKTKVDVSVAQADLAVATSEAKRMEAWVGYLTLPRLPDAVIVHPRCQHVRLRVAFHGGPHSRTPLALPLPSGAAAPIYVVDRTDVVRIFVDIPEQDADYVHGVTCD